MSVSFRACAITIVCAALCASAINGQSLGNWSDYIAQQQAVCANYGPNYKVCDNGVCYNPDTHVCAQSNGLSNVCLKSATALCDQACYSPSSSVCLKGDNGMRYVQPLGYQLCGTQALAFNPQYQTCMNNSGLSMVCLAGSQLCGSQCYDSSAYVCNSTFGQPVLCPLGYSLCNTGECYNPMTHTCMSYTVGNNLAMYTLCPKNNELCGGRCYDPEEESCQISDVTSQFCPTNNLVCNTFTGAVCYDPHLQNCTKLPSGYSVLCPVNHVICMSTVGTGLQAFQGQCYNPMTSKCVTDGPYTMVCRMNEEACGGNCYSPSLKSCFTVAGKYREECPANAELCIGARGIQCYDPRAFVCTSNGNYTTLCDKRFPNICPNGQCCA